MLTKFAFATSKHLYIALLMAVLIFFSGNGHVNLKLLQEKIFTCLFVCHYLNVSLYYPSFRSSQS